MFSQQNDIILILLLSSSAHVKSVGDTPSVEDKPSSSKPPQWIQQQSPGVSDAHISFSNNKGFSESPKPSNSPNRAPPPPPSFKPPSATLAPVRANPNLPPVRPAPSTPKPAKLPPLVPKKPKWSIIKGRLCFAHYGSSEMMMIITTNAMWWRCWKLRMRIISVLVYL